MFFDKITKLSVTTKESFAKKNTPKEISILELRFNKIIFEKNNGFC